MAENKKKSKFSIRKLIYNDKYLIIISILAAIVIWCATSMNLSPETTKTISVPLTVDFSDSAASQLGIKCFGEETINVDVTVSCKKYLAKDITSADIKVSLQTNTVTTKGNIEVPVKVDTAENADFEVVSYYPTTYKAYFDVEDEVVMDIGINYADQEFVEDGYVMGEVLLSENSVTVSGPKSYVSQVERVTANVDFDEKLTKTQTVELTPVAVDAKGNAVDYVQLLSKNENITLTVPVLKRTVLDVTSSFIGKPTRVDASAFNISYSVNKVNAGVLEEADIKAANIGNIDFSSLTVGENKFSFSTSGLESFAILDNISNIDVTVTVPSTYETAVFNVDGSNVDISNIPEGYKAEVASLSDYTVTAVGPEADLETINASNVRLMVDLTSIKDSFTEGVNTCTITATIENNDTCWIYGTYSAKIRIFK
ncbi:MAG: CdaR family protein [Clostridium sp.]|nr:CdaR family protein [Clostridium sp.]